MKKNAIVALDALIACTHAIAAEIGEFVRVIEVTERTDQVQRPRRECVQETASAPATDERGYAGAIVGGIAGGLLRQAA